MERRRHNRERLASRRSNSNYSRKSLLDDDVLSVVELTDLDETTSMKGRKLNGKISAAKSVVSQADTLILDELIDLNIQAKPREQNMPFSSKKMVRALNEREVPRRQVLKRNIRTRSRSNDKGRSPTIIESRPVGGVNFSNQTSASRSDNMKKIENRVFWNEAEL